MILKNEQLLPCLSGAVEIAEQNGILIPYRFGRHVRENVYPVGNRFHDSTLHTSGIVCRFVTDSKALRYTCTVNSCSDTESFDVWANGVFYSYTPCTQPTRNVEVALPDGEKTVEIYFPAHKQGRIYDVTLEDGASFAAAPTPAHRILFMGDSITHGSTSRFASMTYAHQVARMLNAEIVNQGIGGEEFNPAAADTELLLDPELVVIAYGTNDWSHAPSHSHMAGTVNGMLAALRDLYPDKKMAMILPIWRADHHLMTKKVGSFEEARTLLCEAAARFDVSVIDGWGLVPHITDVFADARLHPNEFGFQFYAENLLPYLKELLEK